MTSVRPLLTRLHFYAGIFVAPFIIVAAASGLLYAISPPLEQVVYADELTTEARGDTLPLDEQVAAAQATQPDLSVLAVRPAPEEGRTTQVLFDDGRTEDSRRLAVFVDPVEGDVHGALTSYGSSGSLPFRIWIDELHRGLHLGDPGRIYSELAASWLWVIALAGLALWWSGRRRGRSLRQWAAERLDPRSAAGRSARRRTLTWHGALGTWLVLGMLMLSATGLTWSQYAGTNVSELRTAMSWNSPTPVSDLSGDDGAAGAHDGHAGHGGGAGTPGDLASYPTTFQEVRTIAAALEVDAEVEIVAPVGEHGAWVVTELDKSWPTQADALSVDPATGQVVDVVRFADHPFVAKLARWGIDLHMGLLFGIWSQVGLALLAAGIIAMTVLGYRMWWQRRPTRDAGFRFGRPPQRGAWRALPAPAVAGVAVVAVGLGWFLPVWGVSLALFLAVDLALGAWRGRGGGSARPEQGATEPALDPVGEH
ncbi:PepSY domain-containing protein [Nocardioides panacisoli]|uniref:PepSY-associated TM helix domain-containing protein n=1 Tax=Nocardioides panacisoli TaxID=627624 RepID=UPI001C62A70C|nr:PepSY domain-containing protein [Nocardioides panacisoli]QYJ03257.1 PepSY domain-containing protein [Nocardioides panacisoli]